MAKGIKGCVHLVVRQGEIINVFTHLNKLPQNGVVHLKADKIYAFDEFKESHKKDHGELELHEEKVVVSGY